MYVEGTWISTTGAGMVEIMGRKLKIKYLERLEKCSNS